MKKYLVKFSDGRELEVYASSAANAEQIAIGTAARTSGRPQAEIAETIREVQLLKTTKETIKEYVAENGPTTAERISRDTGIPEAEIVASAMKWEPRSRLDGPGKNYVAG